MKTVTPEVTAEADRHAATVVETASQEARANGRTLDPMTAYYLHKAAWSSVTGGDAVRVVPAN